MESSVNRALEGSFLVYIAGIEVPVSSISVHMGVGGQEPTATIDVVPDPLITRLGAEDRLEVVAFYLDQIYPDVEAKGAAPRFCLLFEGEILGWGYSNTPLGRRITFTCGNFIRVLNDLVPFYLSGPESIATNIAVPDAAADTLTVLSNPTTFPWGVLFFGFDDTPKEEIGYSLRPNDPTNPNKGIRRPYDLVQNVLDLINTVEAQKRCCSVVTTNFYARYLRRVRLQHRFVPSPLLETEFMYSSEPNAVFPILGAIRDREVLGVLIKEASQMGMNAPIWGVLQQIFLRMYYETLCISTAPIAQVDRTVGAPSFGEILGPPVFNAPTEDEKQAAAQIVTTAEFAAKKAQIDATIADQTRFEMGLSPNVSYDGAFEDYVESVIAQRQAEAHAQLATSVAANKPKLPTKPNCIINYITKPLWMFGIAPSCNVLFPSVIKEIRFEENYTQQPTRIYLNDFSYAELVGDPGNSVVPQMAALRAGYPPQVQHELDRRYGVSSAGSNYNVAISGKNFLVWPEEFFRGPKQSSIRLPSWFVMLGQYAGGNRSTESAAAIATMKEIDRAVALGKDRDEVIAQMQSAGRLPKSVPEVIPGDKASANAALRELNNILNGAQGFEATTIRALREAYARYEYHRQRVATRSGAVSLAFNPYVIPGYPIVVFDDLASGQHFIAYATDVTHDVSVRGMSTTVQFTYAQTLDEFLQEVYDARIGNTPDRVAYPTLGAAPPQPIASLRDVVQTQSRAEDYFTKLLHQGYEYDETKTNAFDFERAILLVGPTGETYSFSDVMNTQAAKLAQQKAEAEIQAAFAEMEQYIRDLEQKARNGDIDGLRPGTANFEAKLAAWLDSVKSLANDVLEDKRRAIVARTPPAPVTSDILQTYVAIRPSMLFEDMFRGYVNALRFNSRPICTLEEYIAFRGRHGVRIGRIDPTDPNQGKGGVYYEQILNLVPGPGDPPTFDQNNNLVSPEASKLPDTRIDWVSRLKAYRSKVLFKRAGWRPDPKEQK